MTRHEASGTRSCSRPSRRGLGSRSGTTVDIGAPPRVDCIERQKAEGRRQNNPRRLFCLLPSDFCLPVVSSPAMWQYTPRVAVVRGLRTPFAKSGTVYARLTALDLGKLVVAE